MDVDEAEAMTAAAARVPTLVWFNYRRVPAVAFARQLLDEGRIGTPFHYNAAYKQQWGADTSRAPTWRMDPAQAGSGVADDLLTHLLDTGLYLNGPIASVIALARTLVPGRSVDDAVTAIVKFENGSAGTFEATRFAIGCRNQKTFEIHGSAGQLRFNLERLNHLEFFDATAPSTEQGLRDVMVTDLKHPVFGHFWRPGHIIGYEHTFIATLADFLACLSRGVEFHPNFTDALAVQRALAALQRSAASGQWADVTR
jgi:predicted dehydrogenase